MKLIRTPDLELAQITQVILTPKARQKWTRRLQQRTQPDLSPKAGVSSTHPGKHGKWEQPGVSHPMNSFMFEANQPKGMITEEFSK